MVEQFAPTEKVYLTAEGTKFSIHDMLAYFEKYGAMRVSDLHIKICTPPAFRIDGDLVKLKGEPVTEDIAKKLIYPLLTQKKLEDLKQNFAVDLSYRFGQTQFRINVFCENDGISAALRALMAEIPKIEDVGFPNSVWEDIIQVKQGLCIMTGITGSGKSTTIASLVDRISEKRAARIITMEDPIEYIFEQKYSMISQRELGKNLISFADGLRSVLREDPDIIVVGEMRDPETIMMTLMAAETGHLVFSTLHTRDVTGTVSRICDYFPEGKQQEVRNQLSLGLSYVISQKLLPKKDGTGRVVAMEILNNNYACANMIRTGKVERIYSQLQTKTRDWPDEKMITMEKHLVRLVKEDTVDLVEAKKWCNNINAFLDAMKWN